MRNDAPRFIGKFEVSPVGLGCMSLSGYPESKSFMVDKRDLAISTVHAALDAGLTYLDTADAYAPTWNTYGHNEVLLSEAVRTWNGSPEQKLNIVVATKAGLTRARGTDWFGTGGFNSSKSYLYRAVEASALRLGVSKIQLWHHHRPDPSLTFEEQYENVNSLKDHGIVESIGLSNVNSAQLDVALKIIGGPKDGGIVSVQNELSPRFSLNIDVLEKCEKEGIAFLSWSPFGGIGRPDNIKSNNFKGLHEMAIRKGVSIFALTIAWHLHRSKVIIPIPGATQPATILDSFSGSTIDLSRDEFNEINATLPESSTVAGTYIPKRK
jgi:aryl-alcohol dehydrogenase-like predicted oxidoreductase